MPSQITNYQCPSCTGPLHYDGASGKLLCDYCGSSFSVQEIEALYKDKEEQAAQAGAAAAQQEIETVQTAEGDWSFGEAWDAAGDGLRAYNCPSCGAQLICDEHTVATSCPYCGNPSIVPSQVHDMLRPDYILPFKLDKEAAVAELKKYYRGKILLPKAFTRENHIQEIKGVYVPFWLIDGTAEVDMRFNATRTNVFRQGEYQVTVTDHFAVHRAGTVEYEKIPVDASRKAPDAHMDSLEPFDYGELKPFSTAYMPGFYADRYDMEPKDCVKRADVRAANTAESIIAGTVTGYASAVPTGKSIRIRRGQIHYAMLPVWMLSTQWNDQNFLFTMNGQTGRLVGDLPVSKGRFWGLFAAVAAPLAALAAALLYLL